MNVRTVACIALGVAVGEFAEIAETRHPRPSREAPAVDGPAVVGPPPVAPPCCSEADAGRSARRGPARMVHAD